MKNTTTIPMLPLFPETWQQVRDGSPAAKVLHDRLLEKIDVLKQIRQIDIEHKMEHGTFFLPEEVRAKIAAILLGCE